MLLPLCIRRVLVLTCFGLTCFGFEKAIEPSSKEFRFALVRAAQFYRDMPCIGTSGATTT